MFFYILLFLLLISLGLKFPKNRKIGIGIIVLLCFLSMFRAESVGTDTAKYMDIPAMLMVFDEDGSSFLGKKSELITLSLYVIMQYYSLSSRLIVIFFSVMTSLFLYLALKKLKLSYCIGAIAFLVFFYLSSFNIARQICACSIILFASTYLIERKKTYLFFIFVLLASLIHAASIFGVGLYFVYLISDYSLSKKKLTLLAMFLFMFNVILPFNLIELLVSIFGKVSFAQTYSDIATTSSRSLMGIIQDTAKFLTAILVFNYGAKGKKMTLMDWFFYTAIITTIFSANAHSDVARIFLPIEFTKVLYLANLYKCDKKFICSVAYVSYMFVYTFFNLWAVSIGSGEVVPYSLSLSF